MIISCLLKHLKDVLRDQKVFAGSLKLLDWIKRALCLDACQKIEYSMGGKNMLTPSNCLLQSCDFPVVFFTGIPVF